MLIYRNIFKFLDLHCEQRFVIHFHVFPMYFATNVITGPKTYVQCTYLVNNNRFIIMPYYNRISHYENAISPYSFKSSFVLQWCSTNNNAYFPRNRHVSEHSLWSKFNRCTRKGDDLSNISFLVILFVEIVLLTVFIVRLLLITVNY